ncbi:MFS transporter [Plastoroseomonas hellenica]|uniref:MFS transporter n=1 Tax=Plastoroseomonas hellenica TaxID=2687306 RepID=A0ABS5EZK0_9PROT|nr:MFS transporter [Plastoroseomonas hellenica]MBR0643417.1 MFS transporter [Plastoroseomonas hellenica]MBR0665707.1 MFS transporter [Plastoroseomonas hellenica]
MFAWLRDLTEKERKTMLGCLGGWSLDALDVQIFSFVIPTLITLWHIDRADAGLLGTVTLLVSAGGGWVAGVLSDRYGRVKVLQITILWYALFTFLCGWAQNFEQLFILRALQGLGFGAEWSAGAVLMGEVIRDRYRGRAVGLVQSGWAIGWGAAALLYTGIFAILPEEQAWRALFWIGLTPAVLVFWVRRHVDEPDVFKARAGKPPSQFFTILRPPYLGTTLKVALMITGAQGGSYALSVWLPTYLRTVRGLSVVNTGSYLFVHIAGAWIGFIIGAYLADAIGRKRTFLISAIASAICVVGYVTLPISNSLMLILAAPLGTVIYMMFAAMGPFLTELYPTEVRGSGQGFCYNAGRAMGALFPALVGFLSTRLDLGVAIAIFAFIAYGIQILALLMLPETRGRAVDRIEPEEKIQAPVPAPGQ